MKLRLLPMVLSVMVSGSLLFGGYFAYQSLAMESPMQNIVAGIPGVELISMNLGGTDAVVEVKLQGETSLREVVQKINTDAAPALGSKELKVKVASNPSPKLEQWWSTTLFDIAQAMENRQYSQVPVTLQAHVEKDGSGIKASTEMDDRYVYITLTDGEASKYIMLPRTPAKMGVWSNE